MRAERYLPLGPQKRDGRTALVAFAALSTLIGSAIAPAWADTLLEDSPGIELVDGTAAIECPEQVRTQTEHESTCVQFPNGPDDRARLFDAYRDQLSERRWVHVRRAQNGFLYARWLSADCIERLLVLASGNDAVTFARARQPVCGEGRYNGDPGSALPAATLTDERLFPDALNLRLVSGSHVVECPDRNHAPLQIDAICLRVPPGEQGSGIFYTYFLQLSADGWLFNDVVPPAYFFSRWRDANCVERFAISPSSTNSRVLLLMRFREPTCGLDRYGESQ